MANCKTPSKRNQLCHETINIPPSPFLKRLGYGTGVSVYRLERSPLCNKVRSPWAVKKTIKTKSVSREITRRLIEEADVLRKLNHPNVVGFRAFVKDANGKSCLVMEECSTSLGNLIDSRSEDEAKYRFEGAFPSDSILKVAHDIAKAMTYLHHDVYILHGDIKSHNVLVRGDFETCKLCDFGVTVPLNEDGNAMDDSLSSDAYAGTFCWTAPEVLNHRVVSTKADIYSYGLTLWEMLSLQPPPEPGFDESTDLYEVSRPLLPPEEFGDEYNYVLELFHCCTEEDRNERPNASDLVVIIKDMIKAKTDE